ncbi:gamma-glutamyltransferase [Novosphingobium sp.]|uniref:gamma-glutamyltransferase n=1 Tax=Novosphingobium sp. TaxID=1874826 RepID=UPI0035ADDA55
MTPRLITLLAAAATLSGCTIIPRTVEPPTAALYEAGMVSAADPRASEAGAQMLRQGGTATDAAIATMLALTVVEPQSSGIGGGGFYVAANARGEVETIDGRETAPAAAHPQWFYKDGVLLKFPEVVPGATSVGVPGNIALAAKAHAAHGRLTWAALFAPAIKLAREGFAITPRLHAMLKSNAKVAGFSAEGRAMFFGADGQPLPVGTVVKNPALADSLQMFADQGAKAFYTGPNARAIVTKVTTAPVNPAPMTEADIAAYAAKDRTAVCGTYRAYRVCSMGPPSSGATTLLATLIQLERFDMKALGKDNPVSWHLIAESQRLAYADRARFAADADFVTVPVAGMIDRKYLASRSALISQSGSIAKAVAGTPPGSEKLTSAPSPQLAENGTSHFSVVDRAGNAVSYTSTIESAFGSGIVAGGYYLNNELTDFDMNPQLDGRLVANRVEGGKRPRSSMTPALVFGPDGRLRLVVGAAGGATIPAQVIRAVIGVIDWDLPVQDALALPVLFAPGTETVYVEQGSWLEGMIPALKALGHADVQPRALPLKANAIELRGSQPWGAADPRSEGKAIRE